MAGLLLILLVSLLLALLLNLLLSRWWLEAACSS